MADRSRIDKREYIFLTTDLPSNPDFYSVTVNAKWLYVVGLAFAGRNLTDGFLPVRSVVAEACVPQAAGRDLVRIGKWHEPGHDCDKCPQPEKGFVVIHNYLRHQRSKEQAEKQRKARSEAGKKGADKRHGNLRLVGDV